MTKISLIFYLFVSMINDINLSLYVTKSSDFNQTKKLKLHWKNISLALPGVCSAGKFTLEHEHCSFLSHTGEKAREPQI